MTEPTPPPPQSTSRGRRFSRSTRRLLIDVGPLRRSRDFRYLVIGQVISVLGTQITAVAAPYQVYELTRSSLDVGLMSLAQLIPLTVGALIGGVVADAVDRRRLLIATQVLLGACSAGLALNADLGPALWPLYLVPSISAALAGFDDAALTSVVPRLVRRSEVSTANAVLQALFQLGGVVGQAIAGLLLAGTGVRLVYWLDAASFAAALLAALLIAPQPPAGNAVKPDLRSFAEGFRFVRSSPVLQGAYLIDVNAMVFGMPRALFPALAATVFGGGASTLGFLYAAPGAGALVGAVTTGWVNRIRRQGRAVLIAVVVWGLAIAGFGLVSWLPAGLLLLAVAGWADVISAVFRNTIVQLSVPDEMQGRMTGLQMTVVNVGPRIGDVEAGAVANAIGTAASVVTGGLACIAGAFVLARLLPDFRRHHVEPGTVDTPASEAVA